MSTCRVWASAAAAHRLERGVVHSLGRGATPVGRRPASASRHCQSPAMERMMFKVPLRAGLPLTWLAPHQVTSAPAGVVSLEPLTYLQVMSPAVGFRHLSASGDQLGMEMTHQTITEFLLRTSTMSGHYRAPTVYTHSARPLPTAYCVHSHCQVIAESLLYAGCARSRLSTHWVRLSQAQC